MFILDDILAAPFKGVLWIVKELVAAAEAEQAAESDQIKDRLRELYMLLETGQMTEAEFDAEESTLLDRLDALEQAAAPAADDENAEGGEADEQDEDAEEDAEYEDDEDDEEADDDGYDADAEDEGEAGDQDPAVTAAGTAPTGTPAVKAGARGQPAAKGESDDNAD